MPRKNYHHGDLKNALIKAGVEILSNEGVGGLSLRKVARKAGVSHTAPYAHFADKQALIAAISTEGFRILYERIAAVVVRYLRTPSQLLVETAWEYVQFALDDPAHFKITLSGVVEKEKDYPAFVEISKKSFDAVVRIVEVCQVAGVLGPGPSDLMAVSLWSLVHGFASLLLEGQIPHALFDRMQVRQMLIFLLNGVAQVDLEVAVNDTPRATILPTVVKNQ
jgi:AcrR family transcriptional regulator